MFKPAVKHESKLRLAIAGPSGSGKTYTALAIATALGDNVAVVDTEHGSASKYADLFSFQTAEMTAPYQPQKYIRAINEAVAAGFDVLIMDSTSHAWNGSGGMLEMVEQASKKYKGNSYAAWGDVTPIYQQMIEAIVSADIHIICTMRSKQDYVLIDRNGKQVPQKVGMAPIQRDGFEYEFDVFFDMNIENNAIVSKTRCSALTGRVFSKPGQDVALILKDWLSGESPPKPKKIVAAPVVVTDGKGNSEHNDVDYDEAMAELEADSRNETAPQAQAKRQRPQKPADDKKVKEMLGRFHKFGKMVHGVDWDEQRPIIVSAKTDGRTDSSTELTPDELAELIADLVDEVNNRS